MNVKVNVKKEGRRACGLKRLVVGWLLAVVGVGVMGLSWWSRGEDWTVFVEGHRRQCSLSLTSGVVQVQLINGWWQDPTLRGASDPPVSGPWQVRTWSFNVQAEYRWWGWRWFRSVQGPPRATNTFVAAPLWAFGVVAAGGGVGLVAWGGRARRRVVKNLCAVCGYDLAGLGVGARCPECGGMCDE